MGKKDIVNDDSDIHDEVDKLVKDIDKINEDNLKKIKERM